MLGMLMIAIAILQFLYGVRMFLIAKKMRESESTLQVTQLTSLLDHDYMIISQVKVAFLDHDYMIICQVKFALLDHDYMIISRVKVALLDHDYMIISQVKVCIS